MLASKARRTCLSAALLLGVLSVAGGCTLITDVDRSKIPSGTTAPPTQDSGTDSGSTPAPPGPDAALEVPDSALTDAGTEPDASPVEPADAG